MKKERRDVGALSKQVVEIRRWPIGQKKLFFCFQKSLPLLWPCLPFEVRVREVQNGSMFLHVSTYKVKWFEKSSTSKATAAGCLHTTNTRVARLRWPVSRQRRPVARLSIVGVARAGVTRVSRFRAEPLYSECALGHVRQPRENHYFVWNTLTAFDNNA